MSDSATSDSTVYPESCVSPASFATYFSELIASDSNNREETESNVYKGLDNIYTTQQNILKKFSEVVYRASLLSEESHKIALEIEFFHEEKNPKNQDVLLFKNPRKFDHKEIARLSPMLNQGMRSILVVCRENHLLIIGIKDEHLNIDTTTSWRYLQMSARIYFTGILTCRITGPGCYTFQDLAFIAEFDRGIIREFLPITDCLSINKLASEAIFRKGDVQVSSKKFTWARTIFNRFLTQVLGNIRRAEHGGTILISKQIQVNSDNVTVKYPCKTTKSLSVISECIDRASLERHLISTESNVQSVEQDDGSAVWKAWDIQRRISHIADTVAGASAVDGAVLLDENFQLQGFGSRISVPKNFSSRDVKVVETIQTYEAYCEWFKMKHKNNIKEKLNITSISLETTGLRHLSAYAFTEKIDGNVAIVVSQDGPITVFCNTFGETIAFKVFELEQ